MVGCFSPIHLPSSAFLDHSSPRCSPIGPRFSELSRPASLASSPTWTSSEGNPYPGNQLPSSTEREEGGTAAASRLHRSSSSSSSISGVASGESDDGSSVATRAAMSARPGRGIKTVLSSELEPVTEIPGEAGLDDPDDVPGVGRGATPRTPRRHSRNHRRRSSSSASSVTPASILEESGIGVEPTGKTRDGDDEDDSGYEEPSQLPAGLVLEVGVSAPLICVLLVHDDNADGGSDVLDPDVKGTGDGKEAAIEGALVLVEISGLRVDYKDNIGGSNGYDEGGSGESLRHGSHRSLMIGTRETNHPIAAGGDEFARAASNRDPFAEDVIDEIGNCSTSPYKLCLTAAAFRVKDMHQRVTSDAGFSYLLSSTDPCRVSTSTAPLLLPAQDTVRITYTPAKVYKVEKSDRISAVEDEGSESRTEVSLEGVWANWNPETVAALSIFAYGMYGNRNTPARSASQRRGGGGDPPSTAECGEVDGEHGMGGAGQSSSTGEDVEPSASGPPRPHPAASPMREEPEKSTGTSAVGVEAGGAETELAAAEAGSRGGKIVVEVKRLSMWLNKEVHGRRFVLLEAEKTTVSTGL